MLPSGHNAKMFVWLRRRTCGGNGRPRGTIDSATGTITFYGKAPRRRRKRKRPPPVAPG